MRYERNKILKEVGKSGQKKLLDARVLVAGVGGLGSVVVSNLASMGVGHIGLIDNDVIELTNLNRQFIHNPSGINTPKTASAANWIQNFNPDIQVQKFQLKLIKENMDEVFAGYDIIIDCFDSYDSKFLLNNGAVLNDKTLIFGGVSEFFGQAMTILGSKSACLKCVFENFNELDKNDTVPKGILCPVVSTIGSIQALEAAKIILEVGEPLTNKLLTFDGLNMRFKTIDVLQNQKCCGKMTTGQVAGRKYHG